MLLLGFASRKSKDFICYFYFAFIKLLKAVT